MKKLLASLLSVMMVMCFMPSMAWATTTENCPDGEKCTIHQAAITKGDVTTHYDTLKDAVKAVADGTPVTIDLLHDVTDGLGIVVPSGRIINFDFHDHTYTVTNELAGSSGTECQCFQLLKDSTITMKNGTIAANNPGVAILIQNYSNLTLEGMTLDGTTMTRNGSYALSNNNGEISLNAGTTINAKQEAGNVAMDVCWAATYEDGAKVTVNGAVINGPIELGLWGQTTYDDDQSVLTINNGKVNGEIKLGPEIADEEKRKQTIESLKENVEFTGGEYSDVSALDYVAADKAAAALTSGTDTTYYVGDDSSKVASLAKENDKIEVIQGDFTLSDVKPDVTVENNGGGTVTVNGETVTADKPVTTEKPYVPPYIPTTQKPVIESADNATVTLSTDGTQATIKVADGYELVDVTVNGVSKGKGETLTGLKTGDKVVVTTKKIDTTADEIAAVKATKLVARSANAKAPSGKKAIKVYWFNKDGSPLNFDGYEVYRSTKKNSGYGKKPIYTAKKTQYFNTSAKKGTRYYYKVRGYKVIGGEKVYSPFSLKAIRTAK